MKKLIALCMALMLALSVGVSALAAVPARPSSFAYAYDFGADVLDSGDMTEIEQYGRALEDATGVQAIAVAVNFLDGEDPADYAADLINRWGIGQKGEDNGIVILLSRGDRQIRIGTGRGIDRTLTGSKCGELIDRNIDYFANNDFDAGMIALYQDVCQFVAKAQGKTLALGGNDGQSSMGLISGYDRNDTRKRSGSGLFDVILSLLFTYIVASIVINVLFKGKGCCLRLLFLGWLFDKIGDTGRSRRNPPRPPMGGGFGGGPRFPMGGYRGGFGGSHPPMGGFGGGFGGAPRGFGGGSSRGNSGAGRGFGGGSRGGFGGGGSRGGGGGRSF